MDIKTRIEKLEQATGRDMPSQSVTFFYVHGEPEPTEAQKAAVLAGLKECGEHAIYWKNGEMIDEVTGETIPSRTPGEIHQSTICVAMESTIALTIRIMKGERPG